MLVKVKDIYSTHIKPHAVTIACGVGAVVACAAAVAVVVISKK